MWQKLQLRMRVQSALQAGGVVAVSKLKALHSVQVTAELQTMQFCMHGLQILPLVVLRLQ